MRRALAALVLSLVAAESLAEGVALKAIRFPAGLAGVKGPKAPPPHVPLSQRIVLEFTGKPIIGAGIADGVSIRIAPGNSAGQIAGAAAQGSFQVSGKRLIFTPRLPTGPIPGSFGPASDVAADASLPGLVPGTTYVLDVSVGSPNSIKNLKKIQKGVPLPLTFTTVPATAQTNAIAVYFSNAPVEAPAIAASELQPKNGTSGIWPNPFQDPAGLFSGIPASKRPPFRLVFQGPLDPSTDNIGENSLRLRSVANAAGVPQDAWLGSTAVLVENTPKRAEVLLYPDGVLPFGHSVAVEVSDKFRALSGAVENPVPTDPPAYAEVARYEVAADPAPGTPLSEFLLETFDTVARQDTSISLEGSELASWDAQNSNILRASFGFGGDGALGRFEAQNPQVGTTVISLDTDYQVFPLFSGATPDVPPGTVVAGGVFHFTTFVLPSNVVVIARGSNPLVITVTGDCTIEGRIDLNGVDGLQDVTFDSGIAPAPGGPGGPGGGKGGDGHPVEVPSGATSLKFMQSPQFGESGFGPDGQAGGGGGGGQSGCTLPWTPFITAVCGQNAPAGDGSRGSGGGGGSFATFLPLAPEATDVRVSGRRGAVGIGNHLPIGFNPGSAVPGEPFCYQGTVPGNPTNAVARLNDGPTFAEAIGTFYDGNTADALVFDALPSKLSAVTPWANEHRITMFGAAGPAVFSDADDDNDFIGPLGELKAVQGGQGGGAGGSRTEGLNKLCHASLLAANFPLTTLDAKSGGGGGGGGALFLQVLGTLTIQGPNARIEARGGMGGGGETTGEGRFGGSGGGGSGGAVILQSATNIVMDSETLGPVAIDVSGGCGVDATTMVAGAQGMTGTTGADAAVLQVGDSGAGGPGLVQFHVPDGAANRIDRARVQALVFKSMLNIDCSGDPDLDGRTRIDPTVDGAKTPTPLSPRSKARSTWYDLGAVTADFRPPIATSDGALAGPLFGTIAEGPYFHGTDPASGEVLTNPQGFVLDPFGNDFEVDAPQIGLPDFIPKGGPYFQSVVVRFQGADEDPSHPGSPDIATATPFVGDVRLLNGRRFLRWEIEFDIATNPGVAPGAATPLPQVNFLRIPFRY